MKDIIFYRSRVKAILYLVFFLLVLPFYLSMYRESNGHIIALIWGLIISYFSVTSLWDVVVGWKRFEQPWFVLTEQGFHFCGQPKKSFFITWSEIDGISYYKSRRQHYIVFKLKNRVTFFEHYPHAKEMLKSARRLKLDGNEFPFKLNGLKDSLKVRSYEKVVTWIEDYANHAKQKGISK